MAIAEIFIGAFITVLFEKLASADLIRLARSAEIYSELDKWKSTLSQIQAVLVDAGHKHIKDKSIQLWLNKLQHLAYEMDDVLDDLATEAMRRQLKQESNATDNIDTSKSLISISQTSCCTNFCTPRTIKYDSKMASKLDEITTKLRALVEEKNILGLINNVERSNSKSRRLEETSLVDLSRIVGRDGDKEVLLGKLLGNEPCNENVSIVSIVGLGGKGKTTLAQVLYNDRKVKAHFKLMSWVCVSDEFDVFDISKAIFKDVGGEDKKFETLNQLQLALTEKLANRRFLLVLDDVWNENYNEWELLQRPFAVGAPGSKVIVTTRKTMVASVMDSVQAYPLELLSNEKALSLLAQHALGKQNFDSHPTHKLHGEGIVRKCGGLPLALRAIGRVLRTKPNDEEWRELLNSEVWNLQNESKILPALRLSYYDLPPHLKQMFAYCCLFPKDYVFDKDELVLLWMAEGLLYEANAGKPIETLGRECFEELESRSFFQQSPNDKSRYTMHELINDLATSVAREFFYMFGDKMDVHDTNEVLEKSHHLSFIRERYGVYRKFKVPRCIGSLKHIRYLNFSNTDITCLPEEVGDLCNLQSLLISGCPRLSNLPNSTTKLINLRHLDISDTPLLNKMPKGIGKLTGLQTLSKVIIGGADEFKISDLKGLPHLQGKLSIEGLHKVINVVQAKEANLQLKKGLSHLEMKWIDVFGDSRNEVTEYEVLEGLRPFEKLTSLGISFYMGVLFPSWVGHSSFVCLSQLTLRGCRSCTRLPTLGHLPSLQKLYVESMNGLKILGSEFLGPPNSCHGVPFPSLKVLEFKDMQGWEEWSTSTHKTGSFPCLHEISIINCPKLDVVEVELVSSVKVVCVRECSAVVLTSIISVSSSIIRLTAWDVKGLIQLNVEVLEHLREVEYLRILQCDELTHLWNSEAEASEILVSLQKLEVSGCVNLVSLGQKKANVVSSIDSFREVEINNCPRLENYHCPNNIEKLKISSCRSLTSIKFPTTHDVPSTLKILNIEDCDNLETDWLVDNFLSSLEYLVIYRMPKLRLFPEGCLVHLTTLMISSCDNLESIPGHGFGFLPFLCLKSLLINNCMNLKSFPDEHLQSLTSLEYMWISYCPSMDNSFPCGLWPPNLSNLSIGSLKKPISEWGQQNFPTTLVTLILYGENSGAIPFAKADDTRNTATTSSFLLPPSLTYLYISDFMDMESLSMGLQHLTCLEELVIISCPNLKDLPVTLLPSLSRFWVNYCPKLRKKCSRKGKYWPIISQIPDLDVK
ncbi:putative P-loop containing nucleoside triphosphate hydrolase, leucine-rich repeat domain superfamily [Helianthus annuus]|nr:putative P-loop containing nucleoside triphosphate hydrolase, leucine-rich repeat domain superfamily [Helianthus annuus]KAJ0626773.1 putative P-loop containing nucleoside triphosphate hydrolase, leucine-rich repeat domain superfamily [Helianthus annuus]KAJ0783122.1 putative P-loop containing nucleoside triphosphate hydrolase, leucine-rich repeat domain superfamily [Helianthus annuus]